MHVTCMHETTDAQVRACLVGLLLACMVSTHPPTPLRAHIGATGRQRAAGSEDK